MLWRRVVYSRLENVLTCFSLDHRLNVLLVQWELFGKLVRLAEDVNWLLEVLSYESDSVRSNLVNNASVGKDRLASDHDTVYHLH